ncbi:MAG: substrate-binding domain-containing protein, partial [Victivallaceae bacterium]|nr:substrate-binding domain-containing protein [Victivallaceae bacterium]
LFGRSLSDGGFRSRYEGVRDTLKKRGGKLIDFEGFDGNELASRTACDRLERFVEENKITAAVAAYDEIALSFQGELLRRGHALPEYLSFIGFDDQTPSRYVSPSLTTARMPLNMMVQSISALLRDKPADGAAVEREIDFTLMVRESVANLTENKEVAVMD